AYAELRWQRAKPPLEEIRRHGLFPIWSIAKELGEAEAENEFCGERHGMPLSIMDLKLSVPGGKSSRITCFEGLLVTLTLPRQAGGIVLIIPSGVFEHSLRLSAAEKVEVEDPDFSAAYRVYASDPAAARALLTPAFIERWMALRQQAAPDQAEVREQLEPAFMQGKLPKLPVPRQSEPSLQQGKGGMMDYLKMAGIDYQLEPLALVCDSRLLLTFPIPENHNPFTYAPSYRHAATDREMLTHLHERLTAIWQVVDAMVPLAQCVQ
ncbi:MAG: DUF3137 domain-containing protein, partial [Pseudomonadales bacterium]|nr:DUF3137 domain-containing protein [Pseudomonadales bacterium]